VDETALERLESLIDELIELFLALHELLTDIVG
jgi:hypothetical protein